MLCTEILDSEKKLARSWICAREKGGNSCFHAFDENSSMQSCLNLTCHMIPMYCRKRPSRISGCLRMSTCAPCAGQVHPSRLRRRIVITVASSARTVGFCVNSRRVCRFSSFIWLEASNDLITHAMSSAEIARFRRSSPKSCIPFRMFSSTSTLSENRSERYWKRASVSIVLGWKMRDLRRSCCSYISLRPTSTKSSDGVAGCTEGVADRCTEESSAVIESPLESHSLNRLPNSFANSNLVMEWRIWASSVSAQSLTTSGLNPGSLRACSNHRSMLAKSNLPARTVE
ncbi:hypothetical protein GGX14DRAFT_416475 [Mycena pura]|uniref:Uncharacterized protein n=1 Tax=Mycena pura TaxID=153505 RepID=A0AAD7E509_9AGAR|nr:hypothetical protein GGX14DRAFT_416475 [Mycena pura]